MIKVFYDGLAIKCYEGKDNSQNPVEVKNGYFRLGEQESRRLKEVGQAFISFLDDMDDDDVFYLMVDGFGQELTVDIDENHHTYNHKYGNVLKLLLDSNDAPQTNLANQPTNSNNQVTKNKKVNDFEASGLLKTPQKQDDWFEVIDKMTKKFHEKHGEIPTAAQAWNLLCTQPPTTGYEITMGKDKGGEVCLNMADGKSLSKSAFKQRWSKRYTKQSQNHQA